MINRSSFNFAGENVIITLHKLSSSQIIERCFHAVELKISSVSFVLLNSESAQDLPDEISSCRTGAPYHISRRTHWKTAILWKYMHRCRNEKAPGKMKEDVRLEDGAWFSRICSESRDSNVSENWKYFRL